MINLTKWDYRFLRLAAEIGSWSKDPSTKVGAVIVRYDHTIASQGFNGFPRGVHDTPDRLSDREVKYALMVHAEMNAILTAREPLHGYTIYIDPLPPCVSCACAIIQAGIARVIAPEAQGERAVRWADSMIRTRQILSESGVTLVEVGAA